MNHKPDGRLPLLSAKPAITRVTLKRAAANVAACLVNRGTVGMMGVNSLPKTVTRQRRGCDMNPGPSAPESRTVTTRLPSHPRLNTALTLFTWSPIKNPWPLLFCLSMFSMPARNPGSRLSQYFFASAACNPQQSSRHQTSLPLLPLIGRLKHRPTPVSHCLRLAVLAEPKMNSVAHQMMEVEHYVF